MVRCRLYIYTTIFINETQSVFTASYFKSFQTGGLRSTDTLNYSRHGDGLPHHHTGAGSIWVRIGFGLLKPLHGTLAYSSAILFSRCPQ